MKIVLVRHGEPDMERWDSGTDGSYGEWLKSYNAAGIKKGSKPSEGLIKTIKKCQLFICSDLRRSFESAAVIDSRMCVTKDRVFREFELPQGKRKLPKFTPGIWAAIFRFLWFIGYSKNSENFSDAKERIKSSMEKLIELSLKHSYIAVVGHGLMNKFIGRELRTLGWKKLTGEGKGFWSYSVYQKAKE